MRHLLVTCLLPECHLQAAFIGPTVLGEMLTHMEQYRLPDEQSYGRLFRQVAYGRRRDFED